VTFFIPLYFETISNRGVVFPMPEEKCPAA
jgi:hypothetical protein